MTIRLTGFNKLGTPISIYDHMARYCLIELTQHLLEDQKISIVLIENMENKDDT